ncbi:MAG: hypothetical protein CME26_09335 [Gemmatimonadetes bacterium]|nr:hypothetical protein [Gemmatimonadota bacterium]|tara:strand:- start:1813 stop:2451 length:639 start_codon:yes stop_codon:yes gene_type:complete
MIVKRYILILLLLPVGAWGGDRAVILTGAIGGGLFVPTGDDGDVASPSVALEFSGSIAVGPHWGLESEFVYVPVRLDSTALATQAQRKSSQMTVLVGLRFTTKQPTAGQPALAVSFRGGFARVATRAKSISSQGGWIGGTIDQIENPVITGPVTRATDSALALSPRVSAILPMSGTNSVEVGLSPVFLFNRGRVNTQIHIGIRFALSAREKI